MKILGICGSLRKGSFNRMALNTAIEMAPEGVTIERYERIGEFPLYNQDVEDKGFPDAVQDMAEKIRQADALLIVTPEYNYSVPGVLKNALDWVSRLPKQPFFGKPGAIMGASPGKLGTARAQYHLRQVCVTLNIRLLNGPEIMIDRADKKFDKDGRLTDEDTRKYIGKLLAALADWTRQLQPR